MKQTVILRITQTQVKIYNKFPWESYHHLPFLRKLYYYIEDNFCYSTHSIFALDEIAEKLPHLKPLLPNIKKTLNDNPTALIKLVFSS